MSVLFWVLVGIVSYGYFGYPVLAAITARVLNRRVRKGPCHATVSVVIAAYNEERSIIDRLRNVLESDFPANRLEVVVASDGSSDRTVERAETVDDERVRVLDLPRQGKADALAEGARHARGEILVFTDANTVFRPDALSMMVRNFADPDVGGVAGRTAYRIGDDAESTGRGEDLYWRYDTWLKELESLTGSVVSAHGGMYAVRRSLFRPVEDPAVTDDFAISTAVVAQGKRLVFEPEALGYEETMARSDTEFRRRVRLMTRGIRGVILRRDLLNPTHHGFYAVSLMSRKLLRRLLPVCFPPMLLSSAALAPTSSFFTVVTCAQLSFLALALAGWAFRGSTLGKVAPLYVPLFFVLANLASLAAIWNVARGRRIARWTPHRHTQDGGPARQFQPTNG